MDKRSWSYQLLGDQKKLLDMSQSINDHHRDINNRLATELDMKERELEAVKSRVALLEANETKAIDSILKMLTELDKYEALKKYTRELELHYKLKKDDLGEQIAELLIENVSLKERIAENEAETEQLRSQKDCIAHRLIKDQALATYYRQRPESGADLKHLSLQD